MKSKLTYIMKVLFLSIPIVILGFIIFFAESLSSEMITGLFSIFIITSMVVTIYILIYKFLLIGKELQKNPSMLNEKIPIYDILFVLFCGILIVSPRFLDTFPTWVPYTMAGVGILLRIAYSIYTRKIKK